MIRMDVEESMCAGKKDTTAKAEAPVFEARATVGRANLRVDGSGMAPEGN